METPTSIDSASHVVRGTLSSAVDETDQWRAQAYDLLALLLARAPDKDTLEQIRVLNGDRASALGKAVNILAQSACELNEQSIKREFLDLFVGMGRGELMPYASYYLTGFVHERPLANLRQDMDTLGIARSASNSEPEDHVASLCEMMSGLILGKFTGPVAQEAQDKFYKRHLQPWVRHFFSDLKSAEAARFYYAVGDFGIALMDIEVEALRMGAGSH